MIDLKQKIAVVLPCYNEEKSIGKVVHDFKELFPNASVYVFDNNSTDASVEKSKLAGATIIKESMQGKGNVVRRMFREIDADIYLITDGDGTYESGIAPMMVQLLLSDRLDMVVGCRKKSDGHDDAYKFGHIFGNKIFNYLTAVIFGRGFSDIFSGYRVMSKRFVKSFPIIGRGFEIEMEMTVHALNLGLPIGEVDVAYYNRPDGSESKLRTYRDGLRIFSALIRLFKDHRPLVFFGILSAILGIIATTLFIPVLSVFIKTGLVPRLPTVVLCASIGLCSLLSLTCGLVLDSVARQRMEAKLLAYLSVS